MASSVDSTATTVRALRGMTKSLSFDRFKHRLNKGKGTESEDSNERTPTSSDSPTRGPLLRKSLSFDRFKERLNKGKDMENEDSNETKPPISDGAPRRTRLKKVLSFERRDPFSRLKSRFPECTEAEIKWAVIQKGGSTGAQTCKLLEAMHPKANEGASLVQQARQIAEAEAHKKELAAAEARRKALDMAHDAAKERDAALAERDEVMKSRDEAASAAENLRAQLQSVATDLQLGDDAEALRKILDVMQGDGSPAEDSILYASTSLPESSPESMVEPSWLTAAAANTIRDFGDRQSVQSPFRQDRMDRI